MRGDPPDYLQPISYKKIFKVTVDSIDGDKERGRFLLPGIIPFTLYLQNKNKVHSLFDWL